VRETDALGRLGGDEFVVIADGLSLAAGPELIAERLLEAFARGLWDASSDALDLLREAYLDVEGDLEEASA